MHLPRSSRWRRPPNPGVSTKKSFQVNYVTIEIAEDAEYRGGFRVIERGRGYVRVIILYEEELRWLQTLCRKSQGYRERRRQLGSIRGGARTLICSLISDGLGRMLELRLFAPFGRRLIMIPELSEGSGWSFLANLLESFIPKQVPAPSYNIAPTGLSKAMPVRRNLKDNRTYLQAATIPNWNAGSIRSYSTKQKVVVNYEDAVERSQDMSRCLVGWFEVSASDNPDLIRVQNWVNIKWKFPGGVSVKELDKESFLFIFPSKETATQILKAEHMIDGKSLILDVWQSWSCCSRSGRSQKSVWIKVVGLPVFLRNYNVFRSIGNFCGGFLGVEADWYNSSNYKWIRIKIKGDGRSVPASIPVAVGKINYDCPVWAERSPWMDWDEAKYINGVFRPPGEELKVARGFEEPEGPSWRKVNAKGRQKVASFNGQRNQQESSNYNQTRSKVKWVKVGEKNTNQLKSQISNSIKVDLLSLNRFETLGKMPDQESPPAFISEPSFNEDHSMEAGISTEDEWTTPSSLAREKTEVGKFFGKKYSSKKTSNNQRFEKTPMPLIPINLSGSFSEEPSLEISNQLAIINCPEDSPTPIDCTPLATCQPEDWNQDMLQLKVSGGDQLKISKWVLNKMKTFKRILGISNEGMDDKLMELLQSIEETRRSQQGGDKKKSKGSGIAARELKNLEWSISYDKGTLQPTSQPVLEWRRSRKQLSISLE